MHRLAALSLVLCSYGVSADEPAPAVRYANEMRRFAQADEENPFPARGVVFTGSSSIRLWDLGRDFPDLKPLNRGFGGSHLRDVNDHFDRVVLRHDPRVVVVYAGDNDIAAGRTAEQVRDEFVRFMESVRAKLPRTKVVYVAVKPSPARWHLAAEGRKANDLITEASRSFENAVFVDIWPLMLKEDGTPDESLFVKDRLHLSDRGYAIWTEAVRPHLADPDRDPAAAK